MRRRALAILLGVALSLVVVEVALRVLDPDADGLRGLHQVRPDRAWLYGLVPNAERRLADTGDVVYRTNADGFRDRPYARPKPPGVFRILVLGDSLTFGYGVELEETLPKLLESELARVFPDRRFEVLNLGVSGYNPYTEAALFADVGASYEPDLVIVEFCINDLNDPTLHFDSSTMSVLGELPDAAFPDPAMRRSAPSLVGRLCARSRVCDLAARAIGITEPLDAAALAPHEDPSDVEIAWLETMYGGIARQAEKLGAPLVVAVFPYESQMFPRAPMGALFRVMELGERNRFTMVNLLPAFRRASERGEGPLFLDFWHPTAQGQRVAANALLDALRSEKLLGQGRPGMELDRSEPPG